jgi:hypothetical protein
LLASRDIVYPKTHDIAHLAERCEAFPFDPEEFNPFAVTIRYDEPDDPVSLAMAREMFTKCTQVLAAVVAALPEELRG